MAHHELFIPAVISHIYTYDPGELRKIVLTLPERYECEGQILPIRDSMLPGSAFLARPFGLRTGKFRRRMYTRSNCAISAPRVLETMINDTHREKADTSPWWQTEAIERAVAEGGTIDVRAERTVDGAAIEIYANSHKVAPNNLILEPDAEWPTMRFLALAFSTGITPFLAYLRYMKDKGFGQQSTGHGVEFYLIASARNPRQLIEHEELLKLAATYPTHVKYHPVLTREWPDDWKFSKGRIMRIEEGGSGEGRVNLDSLLELVPDLSRYHIRLCGNLTARDQLKRGLSELGVEPLSFRAEVW